MGRITPPPPRLRKNLDLEKIHFWVTSFERPEVCKKTVEALLALHPGARVTIADDSRNPRVINSLVDCLPENVDGCYFDFDAGISRKRNRAWKHTDRPFVVFMDDDNLVDGKTRFDHMYTLLNAYEDLAVVGQCKHDLGRNRWANTEGRFRIMPARQGKINLKTIKPDRDGLRTYPFHNGQTTDDIKFFYVDVVPLCCMVKREVLEIVDWDERYKTCGEHFDFFLRLAVANGKKKLVDHLGRRIRDETDPDDAPKFPEMINHGKLLVAFLPLSEFVDTAERPEDYKPARRRGTSFRKRMKQRWDFAGIHTWNSAVTYRYDYGL
jgi:hypothetical protein